MGWVLADSTTIDGNFYEIGTTPPPDVAGRVGAHLRREVEVSAGSSVDEVVEPTPEPIVLAEAPGDGSAVFGSEPATDAEATGQEPALSEEPDAPDEVAAAPEGEAEADEAASADMDAPEQPEATVPVPNRGGKGSSRENWQEYAEANGVEVTDDMERNDIIDACRAAGVPVD